MPPFLYQPFSTRRFFLPQNGEAMDTNVHIDQVDMDQLRSALPI